MNNKKLSLNDIEWGEFFVKDIFTFTERGKRLKIDDRKIGFTPFVTAGESNNGISSFINNPKQKIYDNAITIDMFGNAFYQEESFKCDDNITVLKNNFFSKEIYLFLTSRLNILKYKYSYGKQLRPNRLSRDKVMLPIDGCGNPNWKFMEDYIKQEQKDIAQKVISYYEQKMLESSFDLLRLENVSWKEFHFSEIFRKIQRGKRLKKDDHLEGSIPYISSTSLNNGLDQFIGNEDKVRKFKNNLTLANSGSVGSCFYHEYEYVASDHVTSLTLDQADKYIYLFMATIIKRLEDKYSFNREINDKRIRKERFILPADKNGNPHWEYMSKFMKNLEAEKLGKVLEYIYIYIYRLAISYESKILPLYKKEWKEFWLEDIVDIKSGVRLTKANQIDGSIPFIGSTDNSNGITNFVSNKNSSLDKNVLGVNYNGSVVENFYHPYQAVFSDDVKRVHWKDKDKENKYTYLFLKQAILQQREKYAYGYKFNASRMSRQKILLPINDAGDVDFDYIEKYMQIEEIKEQYKILDYYYKLLS